MPPWFQAASSLQVQLATTAILSGATVASVIFGYQNIRRKEAVEDLKSSIPDIDEEHPTEKVCSQAITLMQFQILIPNC